MGTRIPSSKEMLTSATLVCRVPQAVPHQAARPSHPHCKSCLGDWLLVLGHRTSHLWPSSRHRGASAEMVAGGREKIMLMGRQPLVAGVGYSGEVWEGWWKCFPE